VPHAVKLCLFFLKPKNKNLIMKKLFFLLVTLLTLSLVSQKFNPVHAQIVRTLSGKSSAGVAKSSLTNADTAYFNLSMENNTVSAQATVTKTSGTVAGDIILQGSDDNSNWDAITTQALSDQTTNYKVFSPHNSAGKLQYAHYRIRVRTSGTCAVTIAGVDVRRSN
jgi:hypothetical protein